MSTLLLRHGGSIGPLHETYQSRFKFPTENGIRTELSEEGFVHRSVQTIEAEVGFGIECFDPFDNAHGDAGRRMHRQIKGDKVSRADRLRIQLFHGKVEAGHTGPGLAEPRGGRGQPKRLSPQFIGRDQHDSHQRFFPWSGESKDRRPLGKRARFPECSETLR